MKAIARLVEPSSLISVHSLDVAPVSHSLNRLICQGFVGSRVDRKHLASEDGLVLYFCFITVRAMYCDMFNSSEGLTCKKKNQNDFLRQQFVLQNITHFQL